MAEHPDMTAGAEDTTPARDPLQALWSPGTIRARCAAITRAVEQGNSGWFSIDREALPAVAQRVAELTRQRFPDLQVPLHSRWRHFAAGGVDRKAELDAALAGRSAADVARAQIDLTVISVLLDAGAGPDWYYTERSDGLTDALALPAHRQGRDELLALLDKASGQAAPALATSSAPAAGEAAGADPASAAAAEATPARAEPAPAVPTAPAALAAPPAVSAPGARFSRSEGLAVATFRAFMAGSFSNTPGDPLRVDARALTRLDVAALRAVFQSGPGNPMAGLEGRVELLRRLGAVLEQQAAAAAQAAQQQAQQQAAAAGQPARPSMLVEPWLGSGGSIDAGELLSLLVHDWAPIWAHGSRVLGLPAGDVWPHAWAGDDTLTGKDRRTGGWVPFHKLSQWLVYSLVEPLQWSGLHVAGLQTLTGLPEYRNGGLLLDGGVIVPRSTRDLTRRWKPGDEFIVEWRALTVHLMDEVAVEVRRILGVTEDQLPLAAVLEGGTWGAGRQLAQERRGGLPPVQVDSDGTVF